MIVIVRGELAVHRGIKITYISQHTQARDHVSIAPEYGMPRSTSGQRSVDSETERLNVYIVNYKRVT